MFPREEEKCEEDMNSFQKPMCFGGNVELFSQVSCFILLLLNLLKCDLNAGDLEAGILTKILC